MNCNNWTVPAALKPLCPALPDGSDDVIIGSDCTLEAAMIGASLNLMQENGTFTLNGTLQVGNIGTFDGPFVWNSGEINRSGAAGTQTVTCNGGLTMQGDDLKTLSFFGGFRLVNAGTGTWSGLGDWLIGMIPGGCCPAIFENASGATFEVLNNESITQNSFGTGRFENHGTLIKSSVGLSEWAVNLINTGLIHVQSGELRLTRAGAIGGNWLIEPGAEVGFAGNDFTLEPGVEILGRAVVKDSGNGIGILIDEDITLDDLTVASDGRLGGTGVLRIAGTLTDEGGQPRVYIHILPGGLVEESGATGHFFGRLDIEGDLHIPGGSSLGCFNEIMTVMPGGVVTVDDGGTLNQTGLVTQPIENHGTIRKPPTGGEATIHNFFERFLNNHPDGVISVEGGTMICANRFDSNGTIDIAAGAEFHETHFANYRNGTNIIGDGLFWIKNASNNTVVAGAHILVPRLRISGSLSNGIFGPGNLTITDEFDVRGGNISVGTLTIQEDAEMNLPGPDFAGSGTVVVENHGRTNLIAQSLGFASFNNRPTGIVDLQADFAFLNWFSNGPCLNEGTIVKSGGNGTSEIVCSVTNTGSFRAESGLINFTNAVNTFTQNAGSTELAGGSIRSQTVMTFNGGTLTGAGTITSNINNIGATVMPGASAGTMNIASQGAPSIAGDYTQGAGGTLAVELGGLTPGVEYDQLAVAGSANLNGTLVVSTIDGFVPVPGNSFTILTAASRTGMFANVDSSGLPGGLDVAVTYNATTVVITIIPGAFDLGDMNCDGTINGLDVQPFVQAVLDPVGYAAAYPDCQIENGDIDDSGATDASDVGLFASLELNP